MMTNYYFGIHKAASTWIIEILYDLHVYFNKNHKHYHSAKLFNHDINAEVEKNKIDFFSYTNAEYDTVKSISKPFKGFHIIRDPRDIVVSSYFSHLKSHSDDMWPELNDYRKELETLSIDDGIMATMRHLDKMNIDGEPVCIFESLREWNYENPNILEVKFEDITKNPFVVIPEIFDFLGLIENYNRKSLSNPLKESISELTKKVNMRFFNGKRETISLEILLFFIYKHDFYFKSKGRMKGVSNTSNHYRKGLSGDWKNYFSEMHVSYFKENYGDILIKLGYENNNDW